MAMITDSEIVNLASKYGSLFNIEVTNGSAGEGKFWQAKNAGTYLSDLVSNGEITVKSGLLTIRTHSIEKSVVDDLSFIVKIHFFDEKRLEKVRKEIIDYSADPKAIPEKHRYIFSSKYFHDDKIKVLEELSYLSRKLNKPFSRMLINPSDDIIDAATYLINEPQREAETEPHTQEKQTHYTLRGRYKERIGGVKGDILEVYTARIFSDYTKDSTVFTRKDYITRRVVKDKEATENCSKDIDVGVICYQSGFRRALEKLVSQGYHVNSMLLH